MKILLDECVDRRLEKEFTGHSVSTVSRMGWAGIKNGHLLSRAQAEFDVPLTVDRSLSKEQALGEFSIAVVLFRARSNRLQGLRPLVADMLNRPEGFPVGTLTIIGA